ncbi:glutathione S-transferase U19-like [Rhodamnia argentea]|uniref:Glutathione S-transferase n=1 Tax=Rhodamnia argentea TaxID=178133 RepID=A0A8B8Q437_9MYRT|nr:glutathione S-transferase U19-like [Rhodamnia argentea]
MSKGEVLLLDSWVSPFCMRVKIALNEKGVKYEHREEDLFGGKSEVLLISNPIHKKVPVLLHNGKPLSKYVIIVGYIDETWASPPLLPSCAYGRAKARFWADFIDKTLYDAGTRIWRTDGEAREAATRDFIEILKQLEEALGDKNYFGGDGDAFGFVDIIAIGVASWFHAYEKFGGFEVADHRPKLSGWLKRCKQRESVRKVLPDPEKVYEFLVILKKMQGPGPGT